MQCAVVSMRRQTFLPRQSMVGRIGCIVCNVFPRPVKELRASCHGQEGIRRDPEKLPTGLWPRMKGTSRSSWLPIMKFEVQLRGPRALVQGAELLGLLESAQKPLPGRTLFRKRRLRCPPGVVSFAAKLPRWWKSGTSCKTATESTNSRSRMALKTL